MNQDLTAEEFTRLARAMTLKIAAAGLPFGGGKAGIRTPPGVYPVEAGAVIRAFAHAIRDMTDYIPGPDMGTDESAMVWIADEIGRAVGVPAVLGGIPMDEIGATGYGAFGMCQDPRGLGTCPARQGAGGDSRFGAVGKNAARFLHSLGVTQESMSPAATTSVTRQSASLPSYRLTTCGLAGLTGLVAAAMCPRGPVTSTQVLLLMSMTFVGGAVGGWLMQSRWVVLLMPAMHLAVYEILRVTVFHMPGLSFGRPRFDVSMGVVLFIAVHVMYALVALTPMVLGAILGAAWARRETVSRSWTVGRIVRAVVTGMLGAGVLALLACMVIPGNVQPQPGGVAMTVKVRLGGTEQWVSIRGANVDSPVLLHLSGGPGSSDVGWVRTFNRELEDHFLVVVWEQRGAGKSYPALDPASTLTLDRMVSDGLELTRWLAERFDEQKIYLTGNSWGSTLGVLMAQRQPELFWAYVGTGQMVSQRETDRLIYRQLLEFAAATGDEALAAQLRAFGQPPYRDVFAYAKIMEYYYVLEPYERSAEFEKARGLSGFFPDEYSLLDTWNEIRGFADMAGLLYPQLQGIDFRNDVPALAVPVYVVQGRHELTARSVLAEQWPPSSTARR